MSREYFIEVDDPASYYTIQGDENEWEAPLKAFVKDIKDFSSDKGKWNLFLLSSDNVHDTQIHFVSKTNAKTGLQHAVLDTEKTEALFSKLSEDLKGAYGYLCDMDDKYRPVGSKNIGIISANQSSGMGWRHNQQCPEYPHLLQRDHLVRYVHTRHCGHGKGHQATA